MLKTKTQAFSAKRLFPDPPTNHIAKAQPLETIELRTVPARGYINFYRKLDGADLEHPDLREIIEIESGSIPKPTEK